KYLIVREWVIDISAFKGLFRLYHPPKVCFLFIRLVNRGFYQFDSVPQRLKTKCQQIKVEFIQAPMLFQEDIFKIRIKILEKRSLTIGALNTSKMDFSPVLTVIHLHFSVFCLLVSPDHRDAQVFHLIGQLDGSPISVALFLVIVVPFDPYFFHVVYGHKEFYGGQIKQINHRAPTLYSVTATF